jgi:nucleotide-binding universal stress UspA family protein
MFQKILVPLDGSHLAERALPYAQRLAAARQGGLIVVRVVPDPRSSGIDTRRAYVRALYDAESDMAALKSRLVAPGGVEVAVLSGDPGPSLAREVEERGVDVIVMSTHGRSGVGRVVHGSVADHLVRHAAAPVLLVPAASAPDWPTERPVRIGVPLDGSEVAARALGPALGLADALGGSLLLLTVVDPGPGTVVAATGMTGYAVGPGHEAASAYLANVASDLQHAGRTVATRTAIGTPAGTIVEVAVAEQVDVIVISTHGSGGLTRLFLGSVATGVIQRAPVPVLVVRANLRDAPAAAARGSSAQRT